MNFRYRFMQFMQGRNGPDDLTYVLLIVGAVLAFVNILVRNLILQLLVYACFVYAIYRMFSRNYEAIRRENRWFRSRRDSLKSKKEMFQQRKNDRCHVYKKCPACKAVLRLPHRVGTHTTVCPRCNKEFTVKVRK